MKSYMLLLFAFMISVAGMAADGDYDIEIRVDGISNDDAILAYYYMDKKYIKDTVRFDENGLGRIQGEVDLPTGVYLLAFPSVDLRYFELILGEEMNFKAATDTSDFVNNMKITGSLENQLLYDNIRFMVAIGKKTRELQTQLEGLEIDTDPYKDIIQELEDIEQQVNAKRKDMIRQNPEAYYTAVVKAMTEVEMPENPDPTDSAYAYRFYQEHYFDNIDFNDSRLARTPFLLNRILNYLDHYTLPDTDSINAAAERVIELSRVNYEMFQFCLVGIFNKYARSKIMSHESVYVNLAKKYYISGIADWISDDQKKKIEDRIIAIEPTLLGKKAPEIIIADINGQTRRLHTIAADNDYTVLIFWNSGCGHCKKEMPHLKDVFETELSPLADMEVFAISTEQETDEWTKFIAEHSLLADGWLHAHDPFGRNPMRAMYNIESTPVVLILDRNSKILAKRIGIDDIKGLIEFNIKYASNADKAGK